MTLSPAEKETETTETSVTQETLEIHPDVTLIKTVAQTKVSKENGENQTANVKKRHDRSVRLAAAWIEVIVVARVGD